MARDAAQLLADLEAFGLQPTSISRTKSRPSSNGSDEKAGFALPEALATAVGGAFILGPIGGLLLGVSQGLLGQRMRQGELDAAAEEVRLLEESDQIAALAFDAQRLQAANPEDLQQLDTMQSQYNMASKMLQSPYAETQALGQQLMAQVLADQRAYDVRNEQQAIAAQQRKDDLERALGQEGYTRYKDSRDNFMKESAPYMEVRNATANLIKALGRGTPVDQYAAVKLLEKALDPTSVVRPEEQEAWGRLGSALDRAGVYIEQLKSGKTLSPEVVRDMATLAVGIEQQAYEMQLEREARYFDEITDIGLPEKYHDNFRLAKPLNIPLPAASPQVAQTLPPPEGLQETSGGAGGFVAKGIGGTIGFLDEVAGAAHREQAGVRRMMDPRTGQVFDIAPDGTRTEVHGGTIVNGQRLELDAAGNLVWRNLETGETKPAGRPANVDRPRHLGERARESFERSRRPTN